MAIAGDKEGEEMWEGKRRGGGGGVDGAARRCSSHRSCKRSAARADEEGRERWVVTRWCSSSQHQSGSVGMPGGGQCSSVAIGSCGEARQWDLPCAVQPQISNPGRLQLWYAWGEQRLQDDVPVEPARRSGVRSARREVTTNCC
jgi:hypothetical protein